VQRIFEGISSRYEDAANGVGWDEGEYVGANTWDTYDLLREVLDLGDDVSENLFTDIIDALPQRTWSEIDPYGPRGHEVLRWSWETFQETVKHSRRYFFSEPLTGHDLRDEEVLPSELLKKVANGCAEYGLFHVLEPGQRFYRCRPRQNQKTRFTLPRDLGPPPPRVASQSRMSPAGISMFYGARSRATAKAETLGAYDDRYAIAEFRTTRRITVLDLTVPPSVSLFDIDRAHLYDWALFMRGFIADFRKPVLRDGSEHIDYVPTQVVTEYFRSVVRHEGCPIDGVLYTSTKRRGKTCAVLFADHNSVAPEPDPSPVPTDKGHLLSLRSVSNRVRTIALQARGARRRYRDR
jgi:hypothetical protein